MELITQLGDLFRNYSGAVATEPPASVREDFERVSQTAPRSAVAEGLVEAFRSRQTPQFSDMVSQLYTNSNSLQKAGVLNRLLTSVGHSLADHLASSGRIQGLGTVLSGSDRVILPEQAELVSPETVRQVAEEAEKRDPSVVRSMGDFYAHHPALAKTLSAAALTVAMIKIASYQIP
ncbi:MAG: hypothetical protein M1541_02445 [Acidobacteria bacterium]|nr:hypothetical protein [Acidobacteriota bacterium]